MNEEEKKLDNPVWFSCMETHSEFAIGLDGFLGYHPNYCPFGGYEEQDKTEQALDDYAKLCADFFVVGEKPHSGKDLVLKSELSCEQMILRQPTSLPRTEDIVELQATHQQALLQLVNLVQPGYFKADTPQLGSYYGIFKNGLLVAVTGERMKMNRFTEISAVITHPAHTGKGYAKQLVSHVTHAVFAQDRIPYLHVADSNIGAIKLYEKLGFKTRRKISFWHYTKV
ncbi:GNAT family N-acetyltransferase [Flavobacterium sp. JP2137]|uniref:GNAT family N-acetyltransferase n=1 Tax=Flavobacterium sp. JP2137 TaxID=3414510 RepID=UPI003D2FA5C8